MHDQSFLGLQIYQHDNIHTEFSPARNLFANEQLIHLKSFFNFELGHKNNLLSFQDTFWNVNGAEMQWKFWRVMIWCIYVQLSYLQVLISKFGFECLKTNLQIRHCNSDTLVFHHLQINLISNHSRVKFHLHAILWG